MNMIINCNLYFYVYCIRRHIIYVIVFKFQMGIALYCCIFYLLVVMVLLVEACQTCRPIIDVDDNKVCPISEKLKSLNYVLSQGVVSDNNETLGLTLRKCEIATVELQAFQNLSSLKYVDLSQNSISYLKVGVLDSARHITYLNLSNNALTDVALGLFDQTTILEVLDLKKNKIQQLKLGLFDPLKKLRNLDLSSNLLVGKDLNPHIFDRNRYITNLDLSKNDMSETPSNFLHAFEDLQLLNLDKCLLTDVPTFIVAQNLKTLKCLILSRNKINNLEDVSKFIHFESLENLNLADNSLENIHEDIFKPLKKLKIIVLRNNRLTHLPDNLFLNMNTLANIDLSHNLIESVPVRAFMGTSVKNLNLSDNRFTYLVDNFCLELRNSGAKLKKFYFSLNPWQCTCLMSILDEVKKFGIEYSHINYDGKHAVCVTTADTSCKRHDRFNSVYTNLYNDAMLVAS